MIRQDHTWSMDDVQLEASELLRVAADGLAPPGIPMFEGGDGTARFTVALSGNQVAIDIEAGGVTITLPPVSAQAAHELSVMIARLMSHRAARDEARWVAAGLATERRAA